MTPPTNTSEIPAALLDMADEVVDAEIVEDTPSTAVELHDGHRAPLVADDDWSAIDDGDLTPSGGVVIPLIQLNRKSDGGFLNEDTGERLREISAVLASKVDTRAWWPEPFGKGDVAPSCRSDDGIVPNIDRSPAQQPGWTMPPKGDGAIPAKTCADCPNSKWDGDTPPLCTASVEFLAFIPTDESAGRWARLRFAGMALKTARDYWNSFKLRLPKRPPMAFVTSITLEEQVTDNGTFLVPRFRREYELPFAEARPVVEAREARAIEWRHAVTTDDRQITTGAADEGDPFGDERPFTDDDATLRKDRPLPDPDEKF